jgi:hypothetical protein
MTILRQYHNFIKGSEILFKTSPRALMLFKLKEIQFYYFSNSFRSLVCDYEAKYLPNNRLVTRVKTQLIIRDEIIR